MSETRVPSTAADVVLAIDLGTSGPKVAFVAADGSIPDADFAPTRLLLTPDGGVEQDPRDWWQAICTASQRIVARGTVAPERIAGVCCTAQWFGTVAVGDDGDAIANALVWMDSRGAPLMRDITGGRVTVAGYEPRKLAQWIRKAGGAPSHSGKDPTAHIHFLRLHAPDVYRATRVFLEPKDYLNLRLTGRVAATYDSITSHWVTDTRDLRAVRYDDALIEMSGLDRAKLPELVRAIDVIGPLTAEAAADLGVPADIPVVAGTPDVHSATLGSGAVGDYEAHLYLGTSSWITGHIPKKKTDLLHQIASLPSAVPDRYLIADEQETAGACLNWLRDEILWPDDALEGGPPPADAFERIDRLAASAPPGSNGVIFTPWLNGERTPVDDHALRASWVNQSLGTNRADLVRAVLEGVAYNGKWLLDTVEKFVGRPLDPIRAVGGGARSELWCRIHADVFERTIEAVAEPMQANVRGAGFLGLVGLGLGTFDDLARTVTIARRFEPDAATASTYRVQARELRRLYRRTRRVHDRVVPTSDR